MKRCKRCLAVLLAGLLAVSLLPGAALAEEDAAAGSYQVSAQEVEAESSLDQTNLREPAAEQAVYDENELVTAIVEFEAPAVMDYLLPDQHLCHAGGGNQRRTGCVRVPGL